MQEGSSFKITPENRAVYTFQYRPASELESDYCEAWRCDLLLLSPCTFSNSSLSTFISSGNQQYKMSHRGIISSKSFSKMSPGCKLWTSSNSTFSHSHYYSDIVTKFFIIFTFLPQKAKAFPIYQKNRRVLRCSTAWSNIVFQVKSTVCFDLASISIKIFKADHKDV